MEKIQASRIINKNDTESNWVQSNFVPKKGEIIIYNADNNYASQRIKIGDGVQNINDLSFISGSWNDLTDKPFGSEKEVIEFTYDENENNIILESGETIYYVSSSVLNRYDDRNKILSVEYASGDAGYHIPEYKVDTENANCIWATGADENEVCVYQYEINMRNESEGTDVIYLFSFDANEEGATLPVTFEYEGETVVLKESGMYLAGIRMEFAVFDSLIYEEVHVIDEKFIPDTIKTDLEDLYELVDINATNIESLQAQVLPTSLILADAITGESYTIQIQNGQLVSFETIT